MAFKTSRRQQHSSIRQGFGPVESLESRTLLSSTSTFLKLATGTAASTADVVNSQALKDGAASLGTFDVTTKTKTLSILPSTGDLAAYRYLWQVTSAPDGGSIAFAKNSSNAAKQNTLSFSKPGSYEISVSIQNSGVTITSGTMTFNVISSLSSIAVKTPAGQLLPATGSTVSGTSIQLSAVAVDQFGIALETQPFITWQVSKQPTAATAQLSTDGSTASLTFNRAGSYSLTSSTGNLKTAVPITVTQSLSTFALTNLDRTLLSSESTLDVTTTSLKLNFAAFDQFRQPMTTLPAISWTTQSPAGKTCSASLNKGVLSLSFSGSGLYTTESTIAGQTFRFSSKVVPTLTAITVVKSDDAAVNNKSPATITGASLTLKAKALDQFGLTLSEQPSITWQTGTAPPSSAPKLTNSQGSLLFEPDTAGRYVLKAQSGAVSTEAAVVVTQTLTSMALVLPDGTTPTAEQPLVVDKTSATLKLSGLDQFGKNIVTLPKINWSSPLVPTSATATVKLTGTAAACTFTRIGDYTVTATFGNVTCSASFRAVPTLTSFAISRDGAAITGTAPITVTGTSLNLAATARDQFGQILEVQPSLTWTATNLPSAGQATIQSTARSAVVSFPRSGSYSISVSSAALVVPVRISVVQTATSVEVTPSSFSLLKAASRQLSARAIDQFGITMATQPTFKWTATGGTVSSKGLYVAGSQTGNFTVTLTAGTLSATSAVEITNPVAPSGLNDPTLNSLVNSFYVDQTIDRNEMIQILRSTGSDGNVNAVEFSDLQFLVSMSTPFSMPAYVRGLASDVVGTNAANLKFQGLTLGNLAVGSAAAQLNRLVDKWFLGVDEPQISTSGLTYQTSAGSLFNGAPSRADARQGMLGDCYFIAAAAAIADRNPDAVRNMFIDNGDGTYTVRFYSSGASGMTADYVTVNRRLPAYSNGALGYSGYGLNVSQSTTTLWIALAEKAYAQWNETGLSGRDGTNRYAAIEGGWMWYVNAQVLGVSSTYSYFSSTSKDVLVNALTAKQAVTLGTWSNASAGGLYGSHAYIVTSYNASTDTFSLHNPWGVSHPIPLTWTQLQSNCSIFVTTNTTPLNSSIRTAGVSTPPKGLVRPQQPAQSPSSLHTSMTWIVVEETTDVRLIATSNEAIPSSETASSKIDTPKVIAQITQQTNPVATNDLPADLLDLAFISFDLNLL